MHAVYLEVETPTYNTQGRREGPTKSGDSGAVRSRALR